MIDQNNPELYQWLKKNLKLRKIPNNSFNLDEEFLKRKKIWISELRTLFCDNQFCNNNQSVLSKLIVRSEKAPLEAYYNYEFSKSYKEYGYLAKYKKVIIILHYTEPGTKKGRVEDSLLALSFIKLCSYAESKHL